MKISLWVPQKELLQNIIDFVDKEIVQARNIKSKKKQKETLSSLGNLKLYLIANGTGKCYYANKDNVEIEDYSGNHKKYNCGNEFIKPETINNFN